MKNNILLVSFILGISHFVFSQNMDSTKLTSKFAGTIAVTNNGISFIPTFYLGKPALIFNLVLGKKRLSFEPELRFALEGKPWSFIFWWRYALVNTSKFSLRLGAHPALAFSTSPVITNGISRETITAQRYLAGEISPNYFLAKNIIIGMYGLFSYGFDNENVRTTEFIRFNMNFSNIKLWKQFFISYMPQIYYLRINSNNAFNVTSSLTLVNSNFPLSISAFINKQIQSAIPGTRNFIWNISLIYSFNKNYVTQ